jgi:hypothetical protein
MLGSFPRRIGNQLCFADLTTQKFSQALRRMKRHETTTIPPLSPLTNYTRDAVFERQGGQSRGPVTGR